MLLYIVVVVVVVEVYIYMPVMTSTTIREDIFDDIKKNGWKVSELVTLGYEVRKNLAATKSNVKFNTIVEDLEDTIERQENMKQGIRQLNFRIQTMNDYLMNKGIEKEVDEYVETKLFEKGITR